MVALAVLKHTYDLSNEVLCERWLESSRTPITSSSAGEEFFQHRLVFDRSSLTRWRQRMGEEKLQALLDESPSVATVRGDQAVRPQSVSSSTPPCSPRTFPDGMPGF
jgi:transposase, IS5 family